MFTHHRRVTYSELSRNGYADIAQIADYFQDCSVFQSEQVGLGIDILEENHVCWLLASWQIIVERYPKHGEELDVNTWPYAFDATFGYRNFSLCDQKGGRLAVANSQWILVNTETGHPIRISDEIAGCYPVDEKAEMIYAPRKIKFRDATESMEGIRIPKACIDTNQHMNNAWYIRWALEYVPEDFHIRQVRVEFKTAARYGDVLHPFIGRDGDMIKVLMADEGHKPYAVIEFIGAKIGQDLTGEQE